MPKPFLIIVTGMPGAGKSTFAKVLGEKIYMPLISRDQIKEGYVQTLGRGHDDLPRETNRIISEIFFDTLYSLVESNVSVIGEAAFQHKVWAPMLARFAGKARICLVICKIDGSSALERIVARGLGDEKREYFHGDPQVGLAKKGAVLNPLPYDEPRLDVPTFYVNTLGEYEPSVYEITENILRLT